MSIQLALATGNSTSSRIDYVKRDAAQIVQALNILSSEFGLTDRSRVTIMALHGISGGRESFETSYETITKQLDKLEEIEASKAACENSEKTPAFYQRIRRRLEQVDEQQNKLGITLLEWTPGGTLPNGNTFPSKFKLPIAQLALEAYKIAHKSPDYYKNPGKAIDSAARSVAKDLLSKAQEPIPIEPCKSNPYEQARKKYPTIAANLEKQVTTAVNLSIQANWSPSQIKEKVNQLFGEIDQIRQRALARLDALNEEGVSIETQGGDIVSSDSPLFTTEQGGFDLEPIDQAKLMIAAFQSVNRNEFDLILTTEEKSVVDYERSVSADELIEQIPEILEKAEQEDLNVIIRPRPLPGEVEPILVQLDDLDLESMGNVKSQSFITVRTSPDNGQFWLAVDGINKDEYVDLRKKLIISTGADLGANGAVRLAGSRNIKPQYRREDGSYPLVQLVEVVGGLITTIEQLTGEGILHYSPPCVSNESSFTGNVGKEGVRDRKPKKWPSYERVFEGAYNTKTGKPDISRVDFCWARTALQWGWSEMEVVAKLIELSPKARHKREEYAVRTVRRALQSLN